MLREQPEELDSRVSRPAYDACLDHVMAQKQESRPEAAFDAEK
jgi:hypothetical protein